MITLRAAGSDDAGAVHRLTLAAFAPHAALDPPSGALSETVEQVAAELAAHHGVLALDDGVPAGCLRIEVRDGTPHVRRVAVDPAAQGLGIGRAMMQWVESWAAAAGYAHVGLGVRTALRDNLAMYQHLGYAVIAEHHHPETGRPYWLELRKSVRADA